MSLKLITAPTSEPLSLQETKLELRLIADVSDVAANPEDARITRLIVGARRRAEHLTGRALMPQTWELALDGFPKIDYRRIGERNQHFIGYEIRIPRPPLVSITSIKYIDEAGVLQTMAESDYLLDNHSEPARLMPAYGTCWPATRCQANSVLIRYEAGYSDADSVPQEVKDWMLLRIGSAYANREDIVVGASVSVLPEVDRLLDACRIWSM